MIYSRFPYKGDTFGICALSKEELGGNKIAIGIVEENAVLKDWYIANGFIHTGTKQFEHLPFTVGLMEWSV